MKIVFFIYIHLGIGTFNALKGEIWSTQLDVRECNRKKNIQTIFQSLFNHIYVGWNSGAEIMTPERNFIWNYLVLIECIAEFAAFDTNCSMFTMFIGRLVLLAIYILHFIHIHRCSSRLYIFLDSSIKITFHNVDESRWTMNHEPFMNHSWTDCCLFFIYWHNLMNFFSF